MTTLRTKLAISAWEEKPYSELDDGRKFTRAEVTLRGEQDDLAVDATWTALMYYRADGTGTYVGIMHLTGRIADRTGSFVLQGSGTYDGTEARVESAIVTGSGTGDFAGVTGTSISVSTHDDYPFWPMTLEFEVG